jgi:hypothetical protein
MHCSLCRSRFSLQTLRRHNQYVLHPPSKPTHDSPNFTDDDRAELECVCRAQNANTLIPACEACVAQFDRRDKDDNDRDRDDNDRDDRNDNDNNDRDRNGLFAPRLFVE